MPAGYTAILIVLTTLQVAEAEAGATEAEGAVEDLDAWVGAGAAEAGVEALWETTQRMKRTFMRRRWRYGSYESLGWAGELPELQRPPGGKQLWDWGRAVGVLNEGLGIAGMF